LPDEPGGRIRVRVRVHLAGCRVLFHQLLLPDIPFNEQVDSAAGIAELGGVVQKVEGGETKAFGEAFLGDVEALGEVPVLGGLVDACAEAVDGAAKEQLGGDVQGQVEEQRLEVDDAVGRHAVGQVGDMLVEVAQVLVLGADELLAEQLARVLPGGALLGEDAVSEEGRKDGRAAAEAIVLEVGREEGLHVPGVQDVVGAGPDEQELAQVVARLVVLGDGAEEGEEAAVGVGLPQLLDAVDAERPALCEGGRQLAAVPVAVECVGLGAAAKDCYY